MKLIQVGQRYIWEAGKDKFICEIMELRDIHHASIKIIQTLSGTTFKSGMSFEGENIHTVTSDIAGYTLLEGQDCPQPELGA